MGHTKYESMFRVIVADPPWQFSDKLTMSKVKRGAASHYPTLTIASLRELDVGALAMNDAVLALWVPSALLVQGLEVMSTWGFEHKQVYTWAKTKKDFTVEARRPLRDALAFGMGRLFRGCTEHALIGTKGSPKPVSKSERGLEAFPALGHSEKPGGLQERLERMFPGEANPKLELFARRSREGWMCVGDESPETKGQDIRDWLRERL